MTQPYLRVWVVCDDKRRHVYSVTSDEAQSIRDLGKVMSKYDGDPLSASRTVAVIDAPALLIQERTPTQSIEWCVMHPSHPDEPHRGPMSESAARQWVQEVEDDGDIRRGLFYVACREVGPWTAG